MAMKSKKLSAPVATGREAEDNGNVQNIKFLQEMSADPSKLSQFGVSEDTIKGTLALAEQNQDLDQRLRKVNAPGYTDAMRAEDARTMIGYDEATVTGMRLLYNLNQGSDGKMNQDSYQSSMKNYGEKLTASYEAVQDRNLYPSAGIQPKKDNELETDAKNVEFLQELSQKEGISKDSKELIDRTLDKAKQNMQQDTSELGTDNEGVETKTRAHDAGYDEEAVTKMREGYEQMQMQSSVGHGPMLQSPREVGRQKFDSGFSQLKKSDKEFRETGHMTAGSDYQIAEDRPQMTTKDMGKKLGLSPDGPELASGVSRSKGMPFVKKDDHTLKGVGKGLPGGVPAYAEAKNAENASHSKLSKALEPVSKIGNGVSKGLKSSADFVKNVAKQQGKVTSHEEKMRQLEASSVSDVKENSGAEKSAEFEA